VPAKGLHTYAAISGSYGHRQNVDDLHADRFRKFSKSVLEKFQKKADREKQC
jgi:hypothetical protein